MAKFRELPNPFTVQSPETMGPKEIVQLFVDVFSDFPKILKPGHVFVHGPRGCGKSMMFRYMLPDCQMIAHQCPMASLPYYAVYVPVKSTEFHVAELARLDEKHAAAVINEHMMVLHVTERVLSFLEKGLNGEGPTEVAGEAMAFMADTFSTLLRGAGCGDELPECAPEATASTIFATMAEACNRLYADVLLYLRRLSFTPEPVPYGGPLCGYLDFLCPMLRQLRGLSFMPKGPVYLLLDDADNLSLTQSKVLNTWVSQRTQPDVSLKASTQLGYKTWQTLSGRAIDTPHDFAEVNISAVYTASRKANYRERIRDIVAKRFTHYNTTSESPERFFRCDDRQEAEVQKLAEAYRAKPDKEARGYRAADDAYRYARPDYMKSLAGPSKSSPTYSYSGFEQLVHVSSGIVRFFLEPAARMFSYMRAHHPETEATGIPPGIQNGVIRDFSDERFFTEFERILSDGAEESPPRDKVHMLRNLIQALGGTFKHILLSDKAERRVFSMAFSDEPDSEVQEVLKLGVVRGYFHVSAIGNKEGTGRTPLYILNRILAPHFYLDPTSFAGYLFVTNAAVRQAMDNPRRLLRKVEAEDVESVFEPRQLQLFE